MLHSKRELVHGALSHTLSCATGGPDDTCSHQSVLEHNLSPSQVRTYVQGSGKVNEQGGLDTKIITKTEFFFHLWIKTQVQKYSRPRRKEYWWMRATACTRSVTGTPEGWRGQRTAVLLSQKGWLLFSSDPCCHGGSVPCYHSF